MEINPAKYFQKKKGGGEWQDLIGQITDELNKYRQPPYKPLTYPRVGKMLSHLEIRDLYYILSMKKMVNNWSKWFWYNLKQK